MFTQQKHSVKMHVLYMCNVYAMYVDIHVLYNLPQPSLIN